MSKLVRYHGTGEWSALYVDGKLKTVGDSYLTDEAIAQIAGVEEHYDNDDFMMGGNHYEDVAATLDVLKRFTERRLTREDQAAELRRQGEELLTRAYELEHGTDD